MTPLWISTTGGPEPISSTQSTDLTVVSRPVNFEHVLDPDHVPRRRDSAAGPRRRDALLQPRAAAEARRGDPWARHLGRDRRGGRRPRTRPRQGAGGGTRPARVRLEPDPDAVHQ